jgi:hypothetical protein
MNEYLGHKFNDGKCVYCKASRKAVDEFQTSCNISMDRNQLEKTNLGIAEDIENNIPLREYLGHKFRNGNCVFCKASEKAIDTFHTKCHKPIDELQLKENRSGAKDDFPSDKSDSPMLSDQQAANKKLPSYNVSGLSLVSKWIFWIGFSLILLRVLGLFSVPRLGMFHGDMTAFKGFLLDTTSWKHETIANVDITTSLSAMCGIVMVLLAGLLRLLK